MNAFDRINVARLTDYTKKMIEETLTKFNGEPNTLETKAQMMNQINEMYAKMGLSQNFSAQVESAHDLVETPIIESLPPETDGTIQMGEGDGPEIVTGKTITKVDRPGDELVVNIQVKQPAQFIHIDFNIP
jgi:hypothetical protein